MFECQVGVHHQTDVSWSQRGEDHQGSSWRKQQQGLRIKRNICVKGNEPQNEPLPARGPERHPAVARGNRRGDFLGYVWRKG